ncbi:hypothetical protein M0805_002010 [Coniferiporia weirii]|nr:hypothetical protein M0805_002010 [Coniferiporia weirii]
MASFVVDQPPPTRTYQQETLQASLRQNIIIAMDTGSGKTHVAILRMKIEAERESRKISWFIAPTVSLCEQQRDVIRTSLALPVGFISGALEPNQWTDPTLWEKILSTHRIIVSTPQVLLDALRHGYINLGRDIGLLVFDEAHHAQDKHPYNLIMREFYSVCQPRASSASAPPGSNVKPFVLGLTASPIFGGNVNNAFEKLEKNLDSLIFAPRRTRDELSKHVHRPTFKHIIYPSLPETPDPCILSDNVRALSSLVKTLDIQNDPSVEALRFKLSKATNSADYERIDQRLSQAIEKGDTFVHKGMRDFLRTAAELCVDLGPWAANWYIVSVINKAIKGGANELHHLFAERRSSEKQYLLKILRDIKTEGISYEPAAIEAGCSPKAKELIRCLLSEKADWEKRGEVFCGLIFVTRRDAALALSELLSHHPRTRGEFSIGTLLGRSESNKRNAFLDITRTMLSQNHSEVIADFRTGEKNLVISTAVAEEGIDIQACGSVIRWDLPQNMVSWAQSRGRARQKESTFILMFQVGASHSLLIQKWERLEKEMIQRYVDEQRIRENFADERICEDEEDEYLEFKVPSSGAKVTLNSAISHIAHFCNTLTSMQNSEVQPAYDIKPLDYPPGYHNLPKGSMQLMRNPGPYSATLTLPRLLPPDQRVYSTERIYKSKQSARRHVAFKAYAALYKSGLLNDNLLPLSASISTLQDEEVQKLLKDVEKREGIVDVRTQMDPWAMVNGNGKSHQSGRWYSNELAVEGVGLFTMLTRRDLSHLDLASDAIHDPEYGRRQFSLRSAGTVFLSPDQLLSAQCYTRRLFSFFHGNRIAWEDLNYAYLFLPPIDPVDDVWEQRRIWAETVRPIDREFSARERSGIGASAFGAHYHHPADIFMVMVPGHFYKFQGWRTEELTSEEEASIRKRYHNIKDLEISYPLITAQPIRHHLNFLVPPPDGSAQLDGVILLPSFVAVVLDNEANIMLGLFLPSIIRVIFVKLIALSLHDTLLEQAPSLQQVPLDLVQTALMAPAANAQFNYQRLETLGDTVLKFITTMQLLTEHPHWPEGFLTKRKDHAISNAHLAQSAINKRLYRWIIRKVFVARTWKPDYLSDEDGVPAQADLTVEGPPLDENSDDDENESSEGRDHENEEKSNVLVKLSTKTLADVVESLIGAAYLSGGFDSSVACADAFGVDVGGAWRPTSECVAEMLARAGGLQDPYPQLSYPEKILGYTFSETRKALLVEALMHVSCGNDIKSLSYERMELLGDAVLDVVVTEVLYHTKTREYTPGEMHSRKAALVNTHFLGYVCMRAHTVLEATMPRWDATRALVVQSSEQNVVRLAQCLMHTNGAILDGQRDALDRFCRGGDEIEAVLEKGGEFPWTALARLQAPKFMSDIVESTLGAVYIDSGGDMAQVRAVLERLGIMRVLERVARGGVDVTHPITRVMEWAGGKDLLDGLQYQMKKDRNRITCTIVVGGEEVASATTRYNGKPSEDEVRFQASEKGIQVLLEKYGDIHE